MELIATYNELNAYIAQKLQKPVTVGFAEGGDLKVSYRQRVLIKDITIPVKLHFVEVKDSTLLIEYKGSRGIDMVIKGALSFIMLKMPELEAAIMLKEGHRILVDLAKIKKVKPVVANFALLSINPEPTCLRVRFALKP